MKVNAGLWIDHLKALIVITFDGGEKKLEIQSHAEDHPGREQEIRSLTSCAPRRLLDDDRMERAGTGELGLFYSEVIDAVRDAESILIFGPGEAKEDLQQQLNRARLGDKVIAVEPADRMTDSQIMAKVRAFFQPSLAKLGTA